MEGNWEARDQNAKFYLNVCRPVSPVIVPSGCDGMAAACATTFEGEKVRYFTSVKAFPQEGR